MIANTGDTNSFAEVYWEDKLMPFIGGDPEASEALARQGIQVASAKVYRCGMAPPWSVPSSARAASPTASRTAPAT